MTTYSTSTFQSAINAGTARLEAYSDSAKLDNQVLLSHVIDKPITYLLTWPEKLLSQNELKKFNSLLSRRLEGEPIAYIVGYKEFWSLNFYVSPATLIPRPDTEVLIELVLEQHQNEQHSCLDLGTGTGAIALALASEQPHWKVDAVDFSEAAVKLAIKNAQQLNLAQVTITQSDWFSNVDASKRYDVIVSNPPYIDPEDEHLQQGDVRYEPQSALVANDKGMADIKHIIDVARTYLTIGGYLYFEHGYDQASSVTALFEQFDYQQIKTEKDYNGHERITYACYK